MLARRTKCTGGPHAAQGLWFAHPALDNGKPGHAKMHTVLSMVHAGDTISKITFLKFDVLCITKKTFGLLHCTIPMSGRVSSKSSAYNEVREK